MRFVDASALVKRYVQAPDSARVQRMLRAEAVAVSRLSEVEVTSALARLAREGVIAPTQRDRHVAAFVADLEGWHVVELTSVVTATARRLLLQHSLRAGDALQLASALELQRGLGVPLREFVAYDQRLLLAAHAEQLTVVGG